MRLVLTICFCCFFGITGSLYAQDKKVVTYYDNEQKVLKEVYHLNNDKPSMLEGAYTGYYQNGKVKVQGRYLNNVPHGIWEYFFENGRPRMRGRLEQNVSQGLWEYFYESGKKSMEGQFENGQRNGEWTFFFESKGIRSVGSYQQGLRHGIWNYYYEDGGLKAQALFRNGYGSYEEFYASGRLKARGFNNEGVSDSLWTYYFENGEEKAKGAFFDGEKEGFWIYFHPNGALLSKGNYEKGKKEGLWEYFYDTGQKSAEGLEVEDQKTGIWKIYFETGVLKGEGIYDAGTGEMKEFYESGKLKARGMMKGDDKEGQWFYYYEDGELEGEAYFENAEGDYKGYFPNGALKMEGRLANDKRIGLWTLYNPDGTIAGRYRPFYQKDIPTFRIVEEEERLVNDREGEYQKPEYRFKSNKSRFFSSRLGEFKGFIVGTNPLGMTVGVLPLSVEYYFQERLGYEIQYTLIRDPFLVGDRSVELNKAFKRGYSFAARQKFYREDDNFGMLYIGHELRFTAANYFANVIDSTGLDWQYARFAAEEARVEYSLILGNRILRNARESGITLDIFLGLGVGYRYFRSRVPAGSPYSEVFEGVSSGVLALPVRVGLNLGYIFPITKN